MLAVRSSKADFSNGLTSGLGFGLMILDSYAELDIR